MNRRYITLALIALACGCGDVVTYEAPIYDEVSRVVSPEGKILRASKWYVNIPAGAVAEDLVIPDPTVEPILNPVHPDNQPVPPFIFGPNDQFLRYDEMVTFYPRHTSFAKEITVGFQGVRKDDQFIFELIPGTDSTKSENWVDRTSDFLEFSGGIIGVESDAFKRYLITDGYYDDSFYLDYRKAFDVPYITVKPALHNGKHRATILDVNGEIYVLYLHFVNPPQHNKEYQVSDMTTTGTLDNTSDLKMEIDSRFECYFSNSQVYCDEAFVGKSGSLKYMILEDDDGFVRHKVLFKHVIVKNRNTGRERSLNGFYTII